MKSTVNDYTSRINRVFDYIETHFDSPMTLDELSAVAGFSKFHFSRIFQSVVGETLFQFILRVRLEKAAALMSASPGESISGIAARCGFAELSVFSRNFKQHFGITASGYKNSKTRFRNLSQTDSKLSQTGDEPSLYFCPRLQTIQWRTNMELNKSVEIKEFPEMTLAYVRHIGAYQGNDKLFEELWNRLFAWAGPRGLIGGKDFMSLILYHDDPNVTTGDRLRTSVCITVPPATKVEGEVGKMTLEACKCVVARFELGPADFQKAWDWVYGQWFPASGYQPDDKPCFECYPEEPKDGKFMVDICVPVKPA